MPQPKYSVAFVTTGNVAEARKIADFLLREKLAACCNILQRIESIYSWKGKIEKGAESLMVIKTRRSLEKKVIETVKRLHSYDVPEVIFLPIQNGNPEYLKWLHESTDAGRSKK